MDSLWTELARYRSQFRDNRVRAESLFVGLGRRQFNWQPAPKSWSVAQCLMHLVLSADVYQPRMLEAMARARGRTGTPPFRYGPLSRWMLRSMEPPVRKRYRAPGRFAARPEEDHDVADVLGRFESLIDGWDRIVEGSQGLDLARVKVRSPVLPLFRFRLGVIIALMAVHERRHLWQAGQVLETAGFPRGR
jgi:hypothetical protein